LKVINVKKVIVVAAQIKNQELKLSLKFRTGVLELWPFEMQLRVTTPDQTATMDLHGFVYLV